MADPNTLRWGLSKYIRADQSVSWLTQVPWGWPRCFIVNQSTLRLSEVFHGWSKYPEADPGFFLGNLAPCVALTNSRDTEWRKVNKKWLLKDDQSVSWLTQIPWDEAYPSILMLTEVFHGWPNYLEADPGVSCCPKYLETEWSVSLLCQVP
jgi:hypothetical protein